MEINYLNCQYRFKDKIESTYYCQHMYNFHNLCVCNNENDKCDFLKFHHITKIPKPISNPNKDIIFEACKEFSKEHLKNLNNNIEECRENITELLDTILLSLYGDQIFKWMYNRTLINNEKIKE